VWDNPEINKRVTDMTALDAPACRMTWGR
jgi:hypothetical protein